VQKYLPGAIVEKNPMARTLAELPAGSRITDYISLGVIAKFFPVEKIHEVLEQTKRASVRERDLPAHVVVYYVVALALYMRSSYREVLRCLLEGVQWLLNPSVAVKVAGKSGISQARSRLGSQPLQKLYEAIVAPIAEKRTKGAWYREWRLISLDGSTLDTADTVENEKAFGRPGASRGSSAFPKIRFVALLESGTHILWAARMGKYRTDEITLAQDVVPALRQAMLCLADRFFPNYKLWHKAAQTGADLLWRTRQNARLDVDRRLPDGSYLSRIYASTSDRRNQRKGIVVRVIDYRLKDVKDAEPIYRLITTILDLDQADFGISVDEAVSGTTRESRMMPTRRRVDVDLEELDRVLDGARESPLSEADCEKVKTALHALAAMFVRPRSTEKTNAVLPKSEAPGENAGPQPDESLTPPAKGHGRNGAEAFSGAQKIDIQHQNLKPGDRCPDCGQGNVYGQKEPQMLVRVVGQAPWLPRCIRWNDCAAALAGRCSRPRSRKGWGRKSTMRRRPQWWRSSSMAAEFLSTDSNNWKPTWAFRCRRRRSGKW